MTSPVAKSAIATPSIAMSEAVCEADLARAIPARSSGSTAIVLCETDSGEPMMTSKFLPKAFTLPATPAPGV